MIDPCLSASSCEIDGCLHQATWRIDGVATCNTCIRRLAPTSPDGSALVYAFVHFVGSDAGDTRARYEYDCVLTGKDGHVIGSFAPVDVSDEMASERARRFYAAYLADGCHVTLSERFLVQPARKGAVHVQKTNTLAV